MELRVQGPSLRRLILAFALLVACFVLAASPQAGRQNQAAVPALLIARIRLYCKVPVLY